MILRALIAALLTLFGVMDLVVGAASFGSLFGAFMAGALWVSTVVEIQDRKR